MASQLASGDLVSDRYASALYELVAEKKLVDSVLNDLSNLKNIMKSNKSMIIDTQKKRCNGIEKCQKNIKSSLIIL